MSFHHVLEAAMAACLQGITEFFPVSSSGHLALFHAFFPDNHLGFSFDVFLNFGTCLSILFYYHKELYKLIFNFLLEVISFLGRFFLKVNEEPSIMRREKSSEQKEISFKALFNHYDVRYIVMLLISVIPVGMVGVFAEHWMDALDKNRSVLAIGFFITSGILLLCQKVNSGEKDVVSLPFLSIFMVGMAEIVAILPGISRMGTLLLALLFLGVSRRNAIRFIFFSALPIGLGSTFLEMLKLHGTEYLNAINLSSMLVAFLVGILSLATLDAFLKQLRFSFLSGYVFLIGLITWFWMR